MSTSPVGNGTQALSSSSAPRTHCIGVPRNRSIAHMLVEMPFGPFPMALGVLYDDPRPTFESAVAQERQKSSAGKDTNLAKLLGKGQSWTVEGNGAEPFDSRPQGQGEPGAADPF